MAFLQLPSLLTYTLALLNLMPQVPRQTVLPIPLGVYSTDVEHFNDYTLNRASPAPLPVPNSTKSFWLHPQSVVNPLADEGSDGYLVQDADVCIIGSGITGVSSAYHLSREIPGKKVVVLEAREFCSCSTYPNIFLEY